MMKRLITYSCMVIFAMGSMAQNQKDEAQMNRFISGLMKKMTLEEKAGMCSGLDFWHLKSVERLGIPEVMVSDGPHGLRKQDDIGDHLGMNDSIKAVCYTPAALGDCSFASE